SYPAAQSSALNWFTFLAIPVALFTQIRARHLKNGAALRLLAVGIGCAVLLGALRYISLTKTEVRTGRSTIWTMGNVKYLWLDVKLLEEDRDPKLGPLTYHELTNSLGGYVSPSYFQNPFTGKALENKATPGNFTLQQHGAGVDVLWHDIHGIAHLVATFAADAGEVGRSK
ncbi:MAG: hypothetical protein ACK4UN_15420, partial [Limisphaerales bacterium]